MDTFFSQADGTVDIDVALQGTTQSPYLVGDVSLEALQTDFKGFPRTDPKHEGSTDCPGK